MGIQIVFEDVIKLVLAILVGGMIGAEREYHDKAAGFRTLTLICVGATLFTIFSTKLGGPSEPSRIAAGIVMGVGFLGAGVILRDGGRIIGLTTASSIWLTAALGMGIGGGYYLFSLLVAIVMLLILWDVSKVEEWIDARHDERTYEIVYCDKPEGFRILQDIFSQCGVHVRLYQQTSGDAEQTWIWRVSGTPQNQQKLVEHLQQEPEVKRFRFQTHAN